MRMGLLLGAYPVSLKSIRFFMLHRRFQMYMGLSLALFSPFYATDLLQIFLFGIGLSIMGASALNGSLIKAYLHIVKTFMPDFSKPMKKISRGNALLMVARDKDAIQEYINCLMEFDVGTSKIWSLMSEAFLDIDDKKQSDKCLEVSKRTVKDSSDFWRDFLRDVPWFKELPNHVGSYVKDQSSTLRQFAPNMTKCCS